MKLNKTKSCINKFTFFQPTSSLNHFCFISWRFSHNVCHSTLLKKFTCNIWEALWVTWRRTESKSRAHKWKRHLRWADKIALAPALIIMDIQCTIVVIHVYQLIDIEVKNRLNEVERIKENNKNTIKSNEIHAADFLYRQNFISLNRNLNCEISDVKTLWVACGWNGCFQSVLDTFNFLC